MVRPKFSNGHSNAAAFPIFKLAFFSVGETVEQVFRRHVHRRVSTPSLNCSDGFVVALGLSATGEESATAFLLCLLPTTLTATSL
jgi:hypothetical protein